MKKLSLVLVCLLAASVMALANDVNWKINWGAYTHDSTDLVTEESGAILDQYDVLWQLIYAGDNNAIDPVDITNADGGYVSGDDVVYGSRPYSLNDSGIFDHYLYTDNTPDTATALPFTKAAENSYFVYQRIYESKTPVEGTWYYESELVKLDERYDSGAQLFALGPQDSGIKPTLQVQGSSVPEPATMSLLGLGALAMVLRRKLRK